MKNVTILIIIMAVDFATGLIKSACKSKSIKSLDWLSSQKATKGFLQKIATLLSLVACYVAEKQTLSVVNYTANIYNIFYGYAVLNELISVIENLKEIDKKYKEFKGGK